MFKISGITLSVVMVLGASAQAGAQTQLPADSGNPTPTYRINVVSRTTRAVSYRHRSGATKINFQGTDLMPGAAGEAKVNSKRGALTIEAEFSGLDRPTTFSHEYLTYVLWAISPEGRPVNIGEVLVGDNHRSKLDVTTNLQAFAMIVTAEPYYAVRRPSNLVVLENAIRSDTVGASEAVDAKYELIDRGGYIPTGYKFDPVVLNAKLPLEFFEARNAVRIAASAGAEKYAAASYEKAVHQMNEADSFAIGRHENKKSLISLSREVVQTAEDAREIAVKNIDEERAESERTAGAGREARARARASEESQRRVNAEAVTEAVTGPSMALAIAAALDAPLARSRIRRACRMVPIPMVMAHCGISSPAAKNLRLSSIVSFVRTFRRVREPRLEVGSLKPTWPLRPMPRICRSTPPASRMLCS